MSLGGNHILQSPADQQPESNEYTSSVVSSFLVKIPREIRDSIYEFALKSETTVEAEEGGWLSATSLLKTCKQINQEATPLFYMLNTFVYNVGGNLHRDASTWQLINGKTLDLRRMKQLVVNLRHLPGSNHPNLYEVACRKRVARLCRALFQRSGLEMEVWNIEDFAENYDILEVLEPLVSLRNIQRVEFKGAFTNPWAFEQHNFFNRTTETIKGNSPTELASKMFQNLKAYTLSFERHEKRRSHIDCEISLLSGWTDWNRHELFFGLGSILNLRHAGRAAAAEDMLPFSCHRNRVLFFLQKQYLHIKLEKHRLFHSWPPQTQSNPNLTFAQKLVNHYFGNDAAINDIAAGNKAFLALIQFANSFKHVPQMANDQREATLFDETVYYDMQREKALVELYHAARHESNLSMELRLARMVTHKHEQLYDWSKCRRFFRVALRDMLAQWDDILRTRCLVFKDDSIVNDSYNVSDLDLRDSADTVYEDDDPDRP